jgi:hypothetical protein
MGLLFVEVAFAGDEASDPDLFHWDAATLLHWAEEQYANGNAEPAASALLEVKRRAERGEVVPNEVLDEAVVQLGEIQYDGGDVDGATKNFEWLLQRHPDASVNPYHHDANLVRLFDDAREALKTRQKSAKRKRYPWWGYAPFGVPQIAQGRVGAGVGFAVGQGLLASVSIATYYEIGQFQGAWWNRRELPIDADLAETQQYDRVLYGINLPSGLLFYGLWAWSVAAGHGAWVEDHPILTVQLSRDEIGFGVSGTLP